jgi:hypothetical protein
MHCQNSLDAVLMPARAPVEQEHSGAAILPYLPLVAGTSGFFERLTRSPDEARAEVLREWSRSIPGAAPIAEVETRRRHKVAGVIQNIRIDPRQGSGSIEATIIDGSGEMVAKWLGRQTMSGIRLGIGLVMEGIVGIGHDGEKMILNPDYQLLPGPEHG